MFKFDLGDYLRDTVTGFKGDVIARTDYDYDQPNQYLLTNVDTTGRPVEWWFPEDRLKEV